MVISHFDRIPNETLHYIIGNLESSSRDLRQAQIVCKRWRPIAEAYIFNTLTLRQPRDNTHSLTYCQLLTQPERGKLVRKLKIDEYAFTLFSDGFFTIFPHIEIIEIEEGVLDWKLFYETFTPKRCKLKRLPQSYHDDLENTDYFTKVIIDHRDTLTYVEFVPFHLFESYEIPTPIYQHHYRNLRSLRISCAFSSFEEIDSIIDLCPKLQNIHFSDNYNAPDVPIKWHPQKQHDHWMESVTFYAEDSNFMEFCNYFIYKFPKVREWCIGRDHGRLNGFSMAVEFNQFVTYLDHVIKSEKTFLKICTTFGSLGATFNHLFAMKHIPKTVSVFYAKYDQYRFEGADPKDMDFVNIYFRYHKRKRHHRQHHHTLTIEYLPSGLDHISLIEEVGHSINHLKMMIPEGRFFVQDTTTSKIMKRGGALSHSMEHCSNLKSLDYEADTVQDIDFVPSTHIHQHLTRVMIKCNIISLDTFYEISRRAPCITDLAVLCNTMANINRCSVMLINMPYNSFRSLSLFVKEDPFFGSVGVCFKVTYTLDYTTQYFLYKSAAKVKLISEIEYATLTLNITHVTLRCKSIHTLQYGCSTKSDESIIFSPKNYL